MSDAEPLRPQPQRRPWAAPRLQTWGGSVRGNADSGPDTYNLPCGSPCTTQGQTTCPGYTGYTGS